MRKSEHHNSFIFTKKQIMFSVIRELLKELGFESIWDDFGRPYNFKKHDYEYDKEDDIKNNIYIDSEFVFSNKEYYMQIVFGKRKMFIMINTKKNRQQKIASFFKKFVK